MRSVGLWVLMNEGAFLIVRCFMDNITTDCQIAAKLLIRDDNDYIKTSKNKYLTIEIILKDETGKVLKRKSSNKVATTNIKESASRCWRMFCGLSRAYDLLAHYLWMETF